MHFARGDCGREAVPREPEDGGQLEKSRGFLGGGGPGGHESVGETDGEPAPFDTSVETTSEKRAGGTSAMPMVAVQLLCEAASRPRPQVVLPGYTCAEL